MYPFIAFGNIRIYIFWIFLLLAWIVFFACLHIFSQKKGIARPIFENMMTFTLSIFFFSRLFHILSDWRDSKFTFWDFFTGNSSLFEFLKNFFITPDFDLSLAGGIIGFCLVFFILIIQRNHKKYFQKYIDIIVPSFLLAAFLVYLGSIFGWQVFGIPSNSFFTLDYTTKNSSLQAVLFALPVFYLLAISGLLALWYYLEFKYQKNLPDGYIGYVLLGWFGITLFIAEFFSGASDIFEIYIRLNHFFGLVFIAFSFLWITKIIRHS